MVGLPYYNYSPVKFYVQLSKIFKPRLTQTNKQTRLPRQKRDTKIPSCSWNFSCAKASESSVSWVKLGHEPGITSTWHGQAITVPQKVGFIEGWNTNQYMVCLCHLLLPWCLVYMIVTMIVCERCRDMLEHSKHDIIVKSHEWMYIYIWITDMYTVYDSKKHWKTMAT